MKRKSFKRKILSILLIEMAIIIGIILVLPKINLNNKIEKISGAIDDDGYLNEEEVTNETNEENPYIPTGYTQVEGTSLDAGFTIQDNLGNQYVWIEVPRTTEVYPTAGLEITEFTDSDYTKIENDLHTYTNVYRNRNDYDFTDTYSSNAITGLTEIQYNELKQKMLKSVYQYKGFYVGKYETGIEDEPRTSGSSTLNPTEIAVIKQNAYPYNFVTCSQAQSLASEFASHLDGYTSSLMFGVQWDLVLKYLETKGATQSELNSDSTNWGNYYYNLWEITEANSKYSISGISWTSGACGKKTEVKGVLLSTGASDTFCKQGIYDLAGNVWEWTLESNSYKSAPSTYRGGDYYNPNFQYWPACSRALQASNNYYDRVGFRATLYKEVKHGQSEVIKEYKTTATGHTPIYTCTYPGCTETYEGTEEAHTGATHPDGKCTVCGTQYETHGQSSTIKEYKTTAIGHTPVYACTQEGCTETYEGTEEAHTGATHPDGKCKVCGTQYETHGQSSTIKEYKTTATGHTPVYKCTEESCTTTYEGTEETHTGGTHENDGTCTVEGCGYKYQTHEQSDVIKEYKTTATGHTPVYACTQEGCTETYEGTEEPHNNETYVDNGDGTHSSTCTECGAVTTENHNYENGECKDCKSKEPEINIDVGEYEILEAYITQIQPKTTVDTFKSNIETNATEINIYNHNNELLKDTDIIGTGMKLELKKENQTKNLTLIVRGDVNGDGTSVMADILIINQYRLNKKSLEEIYLKAGDVTGDGKVDFLDIIKINRYRLHKITKL